MATIAIELLNSIKLTFEVDHALRSQDSHFGGSNRSRIGNFRTVTAFWRTITIASDREHLGLRIDLANATRHGSHHGIGEGDANPSPSWLAILRSVCSRKQNGFDVLAFVLFRNSDGRSNNRWILCNFDSCWKLITCETEATHQLVMFAKIIGEPGRLESVHAGRRLQSQ